MIIYCHFQGKETTFTGVLESLAYYVFLMHWSDKIYYLKIDVCVLEIKTNYY